MEGLDGVYISCDGSLFVGLVVLMSIDSGCLLEESVWGYLLDGERRERDDGCGGGRGKERTRNEYEECV